MKFINVSFNVLLCFIICVLTNFVDAQTLIGNKANVSGIWTKKKSPYHILGEVNVLKNKSLVIEPGTVVVFKSTKSILKIQGTLKAQGTHSEFIKFVSDTSGISGKSKSHIQLENATGFFSYCIFSDFSEYGISFLKTKAEIEFSILKNPGGCAINSETSTVNINFCTFYNCQLSVLHYQNSIISIKNSILSETLKTVQYNWVAPSKGYISNSLINDAKLKFYSDKGFVKKGNILQNQNPEFTNPAKDDFRLSKHSVCIGKADNGTNLGAIQNPEETPCQGILPEIHLNFTESEITVKEQEYTLEVTAISKCGIYQVLINNVLANAIGADKYSLGLYLQRGENVITILATDMNLKTKTKTIKIHLNLLEIPQRRLALVIGNQSYDYVGELTNPLNDADSMVSKLNFLNFETIKIVNSNYTDMLAAINNFGKRLQNYDVGLLYYSGHGISTFEGENYLIPVNAGLTYPETVATECISMNHILAQMDGSKVKIKIVILDACRNNPFAKSWNKSLEETQWKPSTLPKGTFIAYATSPENKASDGRKGNGAYTFELLKYITKPGWTIENVFKAVRTGVIKEFEKSRFKQLPWESTSLEGEFYFRK